MSNTTTSTAFPAKPQRITLDTLPQLFAHHRARFGGYEMNGNTGGQGNDQGGDAGSGGQQEPQAPERPEGVSEEEWNALGDPGRAAILREREARQAAERALAASRARPAPPKPNGSGQQPQGGGSNGGQQQNNGSGGSGDGQNGQPDIAALIQQAVDAAVKPLIDREEQRDVQSAAAKVQDAVIAAAKDKLHDPTDALAHVDLAGVVNDQGVADTEKVKNALDDLVKRKPHLAKTTTRFAPPGIGGGSPAGTTDAEKVKAVLADMQRATGVRPPTAGSTTTL